MKTSNATKQMRTKFFRGTGKKKGRTKFKGTETGRSYPAGRENLLTLTPEIPDPHGMKHVFSFHQTEQKRGRALRPKKTL